MLIDVTLHYGHRALYSRIYIGMCNTLVVVHVKCKCWFYVECAIFWYKVQYSGTILFNWFYKLYGYYCVCVCFLSFALECIDFIIFFLNVFLCINDCKDVV